MNARIAAVVLMAWAFGSLAFAQATATAPAPALVPSGVYPPNVGEFHNGAVVSISTPATKVGVSILQRGGNAVDAAIATGFALAVTYPAAGNLGGGGFMLIHPAQADAAHRPVVIDYRETAPAAATATMFQKSESQYDPKSAAVPGTVRGFAAAHARFGKLPWPELIKPAIDLARNGFAIDPYLADLLNEVLSAAPKSKFAELHRVFDRPAGGPWEAGDRLVEPDLARTLQVLADQGPDSFYTGDIAKDIVGEMSRSDGIMTLQDLAAYKAIEREPLTARYRDTWDVFVPPAPSSGGPVLIEELNALQTFSLDQIGPRYSPSRMQIMAEIMRRAAYDRARFLGDPAFTSIPEKLSTAAYGAELARSIDRTKATPSISLSTDIPIAPESHNTTHFSVIDGDGMAVANTYTLERIWGTRVVVPGMGFILNNDMRAFNLYPGQTDTQGNVGTTPNLIAPGKRPLSSQMPTIVARDGRVVLVTGSPGSQAIPNTVLEIITAVFDDHLSLAQAVEAPRFSHQWFPDQISFETPERFPSTVQSLRQMGYTVGRTGPLPQGDAHSIQVLAPHNYLVVADRRRNNKATASGY